MPRLDHLDDTMLRGAQLVMQIMAKKVELNANLDKERRRTGGAINTKDSIGSGGNGLGGGHQIHFQQFSHNAVSCFVLFFQILPGFSFKIIVNVFSNVSYCIEPVFFTQFI